MRHDDRKPGGTDRESTDVVIGTQTVRDARRTYLAGMFEHACRLRVRYAETDRMGYVYYGVYAQYFEVARVEALRALGISYREMEDGGVMLPVHDLSLKYHKPALYDDELTIIARIATLPTVRIRFTYEVRNGRDVLLTEGETTLVFVDKVTGRPCRAPQDLLDRMSPYFS